jgi:hypothetical protein
LDPDVALASHVTFLPHTLEQDRAETGLRIGVCVSSSCLGRANSALFVISFAFFPFPFDLFDLVPRENKHAGRSESDREVRGEKIQMLAPMFLI